MKKLSFAFVAIYSLIACHYRSELISQNRMGANNNYCIVDSNRQISSLPFGCSSIVDLPIEWEKSWIGDDQLVSEIFTFYSELNSSNSITREQITFKPLNLLKKDNISECECFSLNSDVTIQIVTFLPNFDDYRVFYGVMDPQDLKNCSESGGLGLLDLTTDSLITFLPLYSSSYSEMDLTKELFYIENYNKIIIYQLTLTDAEIWINAKYSIQVLDNAEFKITQTFNYIDSLRRK